MTARTATSTILIALSCGLIAGCANSGNLSTAAIAPEKTAAPKVDPACVSLASQIDGLRQEGSVDRLEKAASGKGAKVSVKRQSLAKQAELNKANADFQAKCGPAIPRAQTAQAAAPAAQTPAAGAATAQVAPIAAPTTASATTAVKAAATDAAKKAAP